MKTCWYAHHKLDNKHAYFKTEKLKQMIKFRHYLEKSCIVYAQPHPFETLSALFIRLKYLSCSSGQVSNTVCTTEGDLQTEYFTLLKTAEPRICYSLSKSRYSILVWKSHLVIWVYSSYFWGMIIMYFKVKIIVAALSF